MRYVDDFLFIKFIKLDYVNEKFDGKIRFAIETRVRLQSTIYYTFSTFNINRI